MARKYELKRRAEREAETRRRIVDAAVGLHGEIGPLRTSISAIAERAGVERPTVYRHFPDLGALFTACSTSHWETYPPPDPEPWRGIADPEERLRVGLRAMYAYYGEHEERLWNILRDVEDDPFVRRFAAHRASHLRRVGDVLADGWGRRGRRARRLRAAIGHALDYFAWRSLRRQGLTNDDTAELMVRLVRAT